MAEMTISDYASIKELENEYRDGWVIHSLKAK